MSSNMSCRAVDIVGQNLWGVTNNLERRLFEHKNKLVDGFSKRYNLTKLLYFEETSDINSAIQREKQIKAYSRLKKSLIFYQNPTKKDLSEDWE